MGRTECPPHTICPQVNCSDGHPSQTGVHKDESILTMTPEALARTVEDFLAGARDAIVLDDGAAVFDLAQAKYSISGEHNKCLLHFWSAERNLVRRVLDVEVKHEVLRLAVQRLGQTRPGSSRFAGSAISALRRRNGPRALPISAACSAPWSGASLLTWLRASSRPTDLERSFGPIYARGLLHRGQSGFAVLGVNPHETQSSIDAALTFGILWLDACRLAQAGKVMVEGLKLFLPAGTSALTRERIAHLHPKQPSGNCTNWRVATTSSRKSKFLTAATPGPA